MPHNYNYGALRLRALLELHTNDHFGDNKAVSDPKEIPRFVEHRGRTFYRTGRSENGLWEYAWHDADPVWIDPRTASPPAHLRGIGDD